MSERISKSGPDRESGVEAPAGSAQSEHAEQIGVGTTVSDPDERFDLLFKS